MRAIIASMDACGKPLTAPQNANPRAKALIGADGKAVEMVMALTNDASGDVAIESVGVPASSQLPIRHRTFEKQQRNMP
jgi:hypothetical protein